MTPTKGEFTLGRTAARMTRMTYDTDHLYASYELTESPETGQDIPVVISWWHHPDPAVPQAMATADSYRRLIRATRMNEHMRHFLTNAAGKRTYLGVVGRTGRMCNHPLEDALQEGLELPAPDPVPYDFGHALVHADIGMYVLLATPQPEPPSFAQLNALVDEEPDAVGMARFELRADDDARHTYGPYTDGRPSDALVSRVQSEEDRALRRGLMLTLGIPHPSDRAL